jgi:hypothetical protein
MAALLEPLARAVCLEPLLHRASQRGMLPYGNLMVFFAGLLCCSLLVASWQGSWLAACAVGHW